MKLHQFKTLGWTLLLCLGLGVMATGCDKDDDPAPTNSIDNIITGNADLSIFNAAINRMGLTSFTKGTGPFTVLAPTNAAFAAIGITNEAALNAIDSNTLMTILSYHIVPAYRPTGEMSVGPNWPMSSQAAGSLYVSKNAGGTFVNGVKLDQQDIMASNGVVHVIGRVLIPAVSSNALVTLQSNPNFKLFTQAIAKAAVTTSFTAAGPLTIFAPTNAAFIAAGLDSTAIANSTAATLSPILRYHIYSGRLFSGDFKNGPLKMSTNLFTTVDAGAKTIKGASNTAAIGIAGTDVQVSNGVIHTINGVLKP